MYKVPIGKKWCTLCKSAQPIYNFYHDRYNRDGLAYRCKDCDHKLDRKPERVAKRKAYWQLNKATISKNRRERYRSKAYDLGFADGRKKGLEESITRKQ